MNKYLILSLCSVLLSACATSPKTNVVKDQLLCQANEICPIIKVARASSSDKVKITVTLQDTYHNYEIQQLSIENGQNTASFAVLGATQHDDIFKMHRSKNSAEVPLSLFDRNHLRDQIKMTIHTDRGNISRYIYKDGQKSGIYRQIEALVQ